MPTYWWAHQQILIQGCIVLVEIGPKLSIFPMRYFLWKFTVTFVCLLCSILRQHFKKNLREHIIRQGCIILAQIGLGLSTKRKFIGKVDQHCIGLLHPIMQNNFKKILSKQIIRLYNFCPNCCLPQKGIFLGNWLILAMSYYWTPLC